MGLKKFISFLILLCFLVLCSKGQTTDDKYIAFVRKTFIEINSEKKLQQVKLENEELTDEVLDGGVTLTGFFKDQHLLKIEVWAGLSYGNIQFEYYFSNDSLVFAYVTENHFRQSGDTLDHSKRN